MTQNSKPLRIGYVIFALGALFYAYEYFLRIAPSVMHTQIVQAFHLNATDFGMLSAFYFYAYTPMQLVVGVLIDRYNARKIIMMAILACAAGSFMIAATDNYTLACIGRFLQGFGSAFAFVGGLKLTSMWLPKERFASYAGLVNTLGFLGAGIGTIAMSYLVTSLGWRDTIQYFAVLGIALSVGFWITTRKTPKSHNHTETKTKDFKTAGKQLWALAKMPRVWLAGIFAGLMFLPTTVFAALWGVPYLEKFHHYPAHEAAFAVAMIFIGCAIDTTITGWLSDTLKTRTKLMRAGALGAAILSIVLLYVVHVPYAVVCILFVVFGILSSVEALAFIVAVDLVPSQSAVATAVAFINTLTMIGGMIFQRGLGQLLDFFWSGQMSHGIRIYGVLDYEKAVTIIPISLILAFILALFIRDSI